MRTWRFNPDDQVQNLRREYKRHRDLGVGLRLVNLLRRTGEVSELDLEIAMQLDHPVAILGYEHSDVTFFALNFQDWNHRSGILNRLSENNERLKVIKILTDLVEPFINLYERSWPNGPEYRTIREEERKLTPRGYVALIREWLEDAESEYLNFALPIFAETLEQISEYETWPKVQEDPSPHDVVRILSNIIIAATVGQPVAHFYQSLALRDLASINQFLQPQETIETIYYQLGIQFASHLLGLS